MTPAATSIGEPAGRLSLRRLLALGSARERTLVLAGWLLSLLASVALGLGSVLQGWSGLPIEVGGLRVYVSFYPPLPICLWWALSLGWGWGAVPAYLATLTLALHSGMALPLALLFACANPLGLGAMTLGYRAIGASRALREPRALLFYVPLAFIASVFSASGALLWTYSLGLDAARLLPIWQGWWMGAFLESVFITGPWMALSWPAMQAWLTRRPELLQPQPQGTRALGLGLLLTLVLGVLAYGAVSLGLGTAQLATALQGGQWQPLQAAARAMMGTAWVFFWVFCLIVLFVAFFGYQALSRWMRGTRALVQQLAHANAELERRSRTDGLTGLHNRLASEELLRTLWRSARRYKDPATVLMLDIDHFKRVNDTHGHAAGDAVIKALAQLMRDAVRQVDVAGRFGGEEFVIGLSHSDLAGARAFAERLRERIAAQPVPWGQERIAYTVSMGIAELRPADQDIETWLRRADAAMYRAKQNGRDRIELATD